LNLPTTQGQFVISGSGCSGSCASAHDGYLTLLVCALFNLTAFN
jgi:hypothetical protein